jgi:alkylation response protein AidB-like acyl-CoA dehydrogenase
MPNFYTDNDDIQFHMKTMNLDKVISYVENDFADKGKYDYAPTSLEDAKDSYNRILTIIGDICGNYIAPRAPEVDREGATFKDGEVTYAKGTQEALDMLTKAEVMGMTLPRQYGGLNCPMTIYMLATELVSRADASLMNLFGLQEIAETINRFGDEDQKKRYLPRFCRGEVTASMALTEPDAGSDLQAVMLTAYEDDKNQWRLKGVKRFITNGCGEISLVLARTEAGSTDARGLSMFIYEREAGMKIRRIEHKLGIHGSPTCEIQFNDAPAELCGKRRMGLFKYVMSLMNGARLGIAAQALGIAEAAYAEADKYAKERVQFRKAIREFIPVSELLADMRVKIEAGRTLMYHTCRIVDIKNHLENIYDNDETRAREVKDEYKKASGLAALLTPSVKAYNTEMCNEVAYEGIQIHGGTGYMQEFNIERHYRDARITNIYEGTTQLQVVAAIGGVIKGTAAEHIDEILAQADLSSVAHLEKAAREMKDLLVDAVRYVHEKGDPQYQDYHSRRLVEMSTNGIICALMINDAVHSERKRDVAKYFIEKALPECRMKHELITSGNALMLEKKDQLLQGKN